MWDILSATPVKGCDLQVENQCTMGLHTPGNRLQKLGGQRKEILKCLSDG